MYLPSEILSSRIARQIQSQGKKKLKGYRHNDDVLEMYAMISFIIGGRRHYEMLYENLKPAFPSSSSLHKILDKSFTAFFKASAR